MITGCVNGRAGEAREQRVACGSEVKLMGATSERFIGEGKLDGSARLKRSRSGGKQRPSSKMRYMTFIAGRW